MKTYRQKDITVQANSLEEAEVLILNELDSKGRVNEPLEVSESNNGWIKIRSEEDLPKDSFNYHLFCNDGRYITMKDYDYYKKYI